MTRTETMGILTILKATYPNFYKQMDPQEVKDIVNVWSMMFADDPVQIVTEAVKSLLCTLKFPPTIADVKEKISLITQPAAMTELEAWGQVLSAIQSANYYSKENFNNLPQLIQRIIGSPNQLREWAMMESDVVNSVIQSNFMRSYKARVAQEKEYTALPSSTRNLMQQIGNVVGKSMMIGDGRRD